MSLSLFLALFLFPLLWLCSFVVLFVVSLGVCISVLFLGLPGPLPLFGFVPLCSSRNVGCILLGLHLLCIIAVRGALHSQLCSVLGARGWFCFMPHCNPHWLFHVFHFATLRCHGLSLCCNSSFAGSILLWLGSDVWLPQALPLFFGLWMVCFSLLQWISVIFPDAALFWLPFSFCLRLRLSFSFTSFMHEALPFVCLVVYAFCSSLGIWPLTYAVIRLYFSLGVYGLLVGISQWSCILFHCRAHWLVPVFHFVVVGDLRCVGLPLYYNSFHAGHFFASWFQMFGSPKRCFVDSGLWLDCLFMLIGCRVPLLGSALLLLSIFICLMLRLIFSLNSFRHDVLTSMRIVSSAFCSLLGVWPIVSAESRLCCCFDVNSLMVGIHLGLCVAGLLTFRQPQPSMAVPLVHDVDGAFPGIPETGDSFCLSPVAWFFFSCPWAFLFYWFYSLFMVSFLLKVVYGERS